MKTYDMIKGLCNKKYKSFGICQTDRAESTELCKKLIRDTVTLEELKQIADVMEVPFEQSSIFPDREQIKTSNE